ncbi:DUF4265 domain-containing protein [Streptomyces antibioticus]|uniref:DUF4265 domain-containing protein n=1 Tax=Streptomyces antibioticus TaxID=1890 RepID=UPI00367AE30A
MAHADLAPFGLDGQKEQLWLEPVGDGVYSVACIPFRTYGLALGARVRLSENDEVSEVVERSSHRVLRILLMPTPDPGDWSRRRTASGPRSAPQVFSASGAATVTSQWTSRRTETPQTCTRS